MCVGLLLQVASLGKNPLAGLAALGLGGLAPSSAGGLNPAGKATASFAISTHLVNLFFF